MEALGRIIIDFPASPSDFSCSTFIHNFLNILYVKYELHCFNDWSLVRKVSSIEKFKWQLQGLTADKDNTHRARSKFVVKNHVTISEVLAIYVFLLLAIIFSL